MRRVLKRRRQRMSEIRRLFRGHRLIEVQGSAGLRIAELDPWSLRAEGLDRKLTGPELAVALGHIAKHRGFRSNRKGERGANASDDSSKMLKAINETKDRLAQYRTVGEMFARDDFYTERKRNREGKFTHSVLRDDQARKVTLLFDIQRRIGNPLASMELEAAFTKAAEGTASLRGVIVDAAGEAAWRSLQNAPEKLDAIASVITFREDIESIGQGLAQIGLEPTMITALMGAIEDGRPLKVFSGAGHIPAKAATAETRADSGY